jgi:hypothetical protein
MPFVSNAVTIEWNRNNLILKRGASMLMIEADKIQGLRELKVDDEFNVYWRTTALQNREARRVFEAWERKDVTLLSKVRAEVHA